jgi:hypothetical protein
VATLPGLSVGLTLNSATFIAETRRVEASVSRLGQTINQQNAIMSRGTGAVTGAINVLKSAVVGLIGSLSVGAIARFGTAALDSAGNLGEMAKAAGVTTKELQVLTVAGLQAGISQEQLANGLGLFARNVGQAAAGVGEFRETVDRYGISLYNANGALRSSSDILADYADRVKNAGSEQERLALLQAAFGRSGRQFINILGQGSEGLRAFEAQALAAGLVLSDELIAKADQASDSIATLQFAIGKGFQIAVVEAFAGSVSSSAEALRTARDAGVTLGTAVGTSMRVAADAVKFAADNFETLSAAVAGFIAFKLTFVFGAVAAAVMELAAALKAAAGAQALLNLALSASGLGVIATVIGVAVAALVQYRNETIRIGAISVKVGDLIRLVWTTIKEVVAGVLTGIGQLANAIIRLTNLDFEGAVAAWQASAHGLASAVKAPLTAWRELQAEVGKATFQEFADSVKFLKKAADEGGDGAERLGKALEDALEAARNEQSQLKALEAAYLGVGASVEQVQAAIEIDNKLRAEKITLLQAEKSGLLEVLRANQRTEQHNKALEEASRSRRRSTLAVARQNNSRSNSRSWKPGTNTALPTRWNSKPRSFRPRGCEPC